MILQRKRPNLRRPKLHNGLFVNQKRMDINGPMRFSIIHLDNQLMTQHTTNYFNAFIEVAEDCR